MRSLVLSRSEGPPAFLRGGSFASLRTWATGVLVMLIPQFANACPVCFGGPNSLSKGMDTAILFLLSIVGLVQLGFVALFWTFWRRAKELRRRRESFQIIDGGVR